MREKANFLFFWVDTLPVCSHTRVTCLPKKMPNGWNFCRERWIS